jgi:hypothetical protein
MSVYRNLLHLLFFRRDKGEWSHWKCPQSWHRKLIIANIAGNIWWEICMKNFCIFVVYQSMISILEKNNCIIVWVASWTTHFFHGIPFILENTKERDKLWRAGILIRVRYFGDVMKMNMSLTSRKMSIENLKFGKLVSITMSFAASKYFKFFSNEIGSIINK